MTNPPSSDNTQPSLAEERAQTLADDLADTKQQLVKLGRRVFQLSSRVASVRHEDQAFFDDIPSDHPIFGNENLTEILAFVKRTSWWGVLPPLFAIAVGLFFPFTMMISEQVVARDSAIEVGDTIPRFVSVDDSGTDFDSRSLNGHLVLIKFFRAHW